ncbi:MAG: IPTL-CTERM sorting domain-containing protein, partial [Myxococcota bacterium]
CPGNIPTLSQWGLILFGMLLLTMMFLVIRRRGLPTHMTASVLLLLAAGFIAVSMSYGAIQSNRSCDVDRNDVAVQLWQEIFSA